MKDPHSLKVLGGFLFFFCPFLAPLALAQFSFPFQFPPGTGGTSGTVPDLGALTTAMTGLVGQITDFNTNLNTTNSQLAFGNQNISESNQLWGVTNQQWNQSNQYWADTNNQAATANQNWANTNGQAQVANQNWANTNVQAAQANQNWVNTNQQIADSRAMLDRQLTTYHQTLTEFQQTVAKEADRANTIAEKVTEPGYIFKAAAFGAAGAVLGATVMKVAISGVTQGLRLLGRWVTGDIKKMKMNESASLLATAMTEFKVSRALIRNSEKTIDSVLNLFKVVKTMSNAKAGYQDSQELMRIAIMASLETNRAQIESFRREKAKGYEYQVAALQLEAELLEKVSLALKDHALDHFCEDLTQLFLELGQAQALTQRASLAILTHEKGLLYQKHRELSLLEKQAKEVRGGKESKGAYRFSVRIHSLARDLTVEQFFKMRKRSVDRCASVFRSDRSLRRQLGRREISARCKAHFRSQSASVTLLGLEKSFPEAPRELLKKARDKKIAEWMQKTAVALHDDAAALSSQGWSGYQMREGALTLDSMVTVSLARYLSEIEAVQDFFRELKEEVALPSTVDGSFNARLAEKRAQARAACLR